MYDAQIGRFMNLDPHADKYYSLSPYCFAANNPLIFVDPDGKDIKPSKAFLASAYGNVYKNLSQNNAGYKSIVNKFSNSKVFNYTLHYGNTGVIPGSNATTGGSRKETAGKGNKSIVSAELNSYFGESALTFNRTVTLGDKTTAYTYERSEIAMAGTIIHEAIHAKLGTTFKTDGSDHTTFMEYRTEYVKALKEYNTDNKLGYTDAQIEDLSWEGSKSSKQFKEHITELAKTNGTTYDEELAAYNKRVGAIIWNVKKTEEKTNNSTDSRGKQ